MGAIYLDPNKSPFNNLKSSTHYSVASRGLYLIHELLHFAGGPTFSHIEMASAVRAAALSQGYKVRAMPLRSDYADTPAGAKAF